MFLQFSCKGLARVVRGGFLCESSSSEDDFVARYRSTQ
jgi:hypothetical protein